MGDLPFSQKILNEKTYPNQTNFCKSALKCDAVYAKRISNFMQFEWDETKNHQNQLKHHISFENTITVSCDRLKELQNIPDEQIDTLAELYDDFWVNAKMVTPITKQAISILLYSDILNWFKKQGKVYQSNINNVLRTYLNHQQAINKSK